jgi:hypothetical protein
MLYFCVVAALELSCRGRAARNALAAAARDERDEPTQALIIMGAGF